MPSSLPLMDDADLNGFAEDDLIYIVQGRDLGRDRKLFLKDMANATLSVVDLPNADPQTLPNNWGGYVIGCANNGPFAPTPHKIPFREVAQGGIAAMEQDGTTPEAEEWLPIWSNSRGARLVSTRFMNQRVKSIYFGTNGSRPEEVQTYALQPEDRLLIVYCEVAAGGVPPTITGTPTQGLVIQFVGGINWGGSTDSMSRIYGAVSMPDISATIEVKREFCTVYRFLDNATYGWYRQLGEYPALGGAAPELSLKKVRKVEEIIPATATLTEVFPNVGAAQTRTIEFWSTVQRNLFKVLKGAIQAAHGIELPRTATPPAITENLIGRLHHDSDSSRLTWWRGKNSGGTDLGSVHIDDPIEQSYTLFMDDAANVGVGAAWGSPPFLTVEGSFKPRLMPVGRDSHAGQVSIWVNLANTPGAGTSMTVRVFLKRWFADGGSAAADYVDVVLQADGTSAIVGGSGRLATNMLLAPGDALEISLVEIEANPNSWNTQATAVTFGVQLFRAPIS